MQIESEVYISPFDTRLDSNGKSKLKESIEAIRFSKGFLELFDSYPSEDQRADFYFTSD